MILVMHILLWKELLLLLIQIMQSVVFKNNAPFTNCISKINGIQIDNAEDLDVVMRMYNLLEFSKKYRKTTGSWWNYYRDEPSNPLSSNSESFKYKLSITGKTYHGEDVANKVDKKNWSCYSTKTFKQYLENCKYTTNQLWNKIDFDLV